MKTVLRLFALVLLIVGVYGGISGFREPAAASLVSIQALPVENETCGWETAIPDHAAARVPALTFFDAIGPASVYAAEGDPVYATHVEYRYPIAKTIGTINGRFRARG